jgi:hypothetical protein
MPGKQKTAFSVGTVYFRHGAKSEPGTSDDIRKVIERQLEFIRKSWIKSVKKVVQAPPGSQIVTLPHTGPTGATSMSHVTFRAVKDDNATPIRLTRDPTIASGSFIHEEVSDGIFDEINNVIDANRALARGQQHFFLGPPVYYRIYAERHHVTQGEGDFSLLLHSGVCDLYAPSLFWILKLPAPLAAQAFANLYLNPKNPHIHCLMRMAILLGSDFCEWLYDRWNKKWKSDPQPPAFYWTFKEMMSKMKVVEPRVIAARTTPNAQIALGGEEFVSVEDLLEKPDIAATLLSKACMQVFEGVNGAKSNARNLDYFAYGLELQKNASQISKAIKEVVGRQKAGDVMETKEETN